MKKLISFNFFRTDAPPLGAKRAVSVRPCPTLNSNFMNFEKLQQENHEASEALRPRFATRTVLFDEDGQVAIINVKRHGYYKIPGGGIENGEDIENAAKREVKEEAGCDCDIVKKLGRMETKVPVWQMLDISDGFIATIRGEKSQPSYEDWGKERGFEIEWFSDLDTAISTIEKKYRW